MRERVYIGNDRNGYQSLFWVGDDGALRVTEGFGGELVAAAYALDAELTERRELKTPRVMPPADFGVPEFHTCIDRHGDPTWDVRAGVDYVARHARVRALHGASARRRYHKRHDALRILSDHVGIADNPRRES